MAPKPKPQEPWKIVLAGDGGVGKSSLAYRFEHDTFIEVLDSVSITCNDTANIPIRGQDREHDPTVEEYHKDILVEGVAVTTVLLDTWPSHACGEAVIREGQAFILVYSVAWRYSFEDTVSHCKKVRQATGDPKTICALVGNKCDLSYEREVSTETGRALARELDCEFFETSAKTGENLELVIRALVQRLRSKHPEIDKQDSSRSFLNFLCCK